MLRRSLVGLASVMLVLTGSTPASAQVLGPTAPYIVVFRDFVDVGFETDALERIAGFRSEFRYGSALKGFAARLSAFQVSVLQLNPLIAFISADREVQAIGTVPVTGTDVVPTGVRRVDAGTTTTAQQASTVAIAVIDTGVDLSHPDLNARNGKNCINTALTANDDNGHGSHVAGTIGARNNGAGVVGVAPDSVIYAVKVLNSAGSGTWSQVICGIDWVTANAATLGIKVANMSLIGSGRNDNNCGASNFDALHLAICRSVNAGVTYAVAAGNSPVDFATSAPASYPEALTVTAMSDSDGAPGGTGGPPTLCAGETDDKFATFSSFAVAQTEIAHTISGPGVCIRSTYMNGGYATFSGTSMATPHVAGITALCFGSGGVSGPCGGLTPASVRAKLRADAQTHATAANGFIGDPLSNPVSGKHFGYLAWAGAYTAPPAPPPADGPTVSSLSPTSGPPAGGTLVTITGTGFSTTAGATTVAFGAAPATSVSCATTTQCTATSPAGSGTVDVVATVGGFASPPSASSKFTYTSDTTAPTISNVAGTALASTSVRILWDTNEPATSQVEFWVRNSTGLHSFTPIDSALVTQAHSVQLTSLLSNTRYRYRVISKDAAGNQGISGIFDFRTRR